MDVLASLCAKPARLVIGLMSGTSADGVDAALCRIHGSGTNTRVEQLAFVCQPYPARVRERLLALAGGETGGSRELLWMGVLLGRLFAVACGEVCRAAGIPREAVDLVGSHGHTLWHQPAPADYLGTALTGTLQIGEPSYISEALGCPVVSDFRVRDMAAGGQGAPLVPYTEFLLYRDPDATVGLQNLGGIGNLTILPRDGALGDTYAFDTGPGNMVMDQLVFRLTEGAQDYDRGGELAARGKVSPELLAFLLDDPFLRQAPPKTSGREVYGAAYVDRLQARARALGVAPLDALATATRFTAECVRVAIETHCAHRPEKLIVGGGGSLNPTLMAMLGDCLPGVRVLRNEDLGLDSSAKEAVAFALLANEYLFGHCGNVCRVTGAAHPVVLGKLSM